MTVSRQSLRRYVIHGLMTPCPSCCCSVLSFRWRRSTSRMHIVSSRLILMKSPGKGCAGAARYFWLQFYLLADALLRMMLRKRVSADMQYLDDFQIFGLETAGQCEQNLAFALATCEAPGVLVAHNKTVPFSFSLRFLRI